MPSGKENPLGGISRQMNDLGLVKRKGIPFREKLLEREAIRLNSTGSGEAASHSHESEEKDRLLTGYINELLEIIRGLEDQLQQNSNASIVAKTMVAGLAHDLRNPLAVISSCTQLCLDNGQLDESTRQFLNMIRESSGVARKLVTQFLEFAKVTLNFAPIDLNQVIRKAWKSAALETRDAKISFRADLADDLPEIFADPEKAERIFLNLFLNAIQAVSNTHPKGLITVQTSFLPDQHIVEAVITDNGPGIPDEIRGRIFDPFFTTRKEGTGLGLHLCSHFIQQHKGEIMVEKAGQRGTKVLVKFPVSQAHEHLTISDLLRNPENAT
jgi:signal transduction histidine kinase